MKSKLILTSVLSGVLLLSACSNDATQGNAIAEVNNHIISEEEFIAELKDRHGEQLLGELIQKRLLQDEANALNITEEDVENELKTIREDFGIENDEELLQLLQLSFQLPVTSIEEFKNDYVKPQIVLQRLMSEGVNVTEEEIAQYFEENKDSLIEVEVRHILVADIETAEEVLAKINAGGDFAELAEEYSTDPGSNMTGGKYDFFKKGTMVSEFEEVAFSQEIGEVSEPVKTAHGYHIIKTTDKKVTLEAKRDEVEELLIKENSRSANEVLEELYEKANINIKDPQFQGLL